MTYSLAYTAGSSLPPSLPTQAAISPVDTPANAAASPDMAENEVDGAFLKMDKPVRSRIELSKNFSIISVEDIPVAVQDEQTQTNTLLMHYPYVL